MTLTLNCQGFDRQVLSWPMCTRLQILILVEEQVNKVNIPKPWQTAKIFFFVKNKYLPLPKCLEAYAWIMSFQQVIEFWHWVEYQIFVCFKIFKCSWVFHFGALSSYFKPYLFWVKAPFTSWLYFFKIQLWAAENWKENKSSIFNTKFKIQQPVKIT